MSTSRALMTMGGDTSLSLELPKNQTFEEWSEVGKNLASGHRVLNWWIGDWWAAGSHRYGERAKVAAEGLFGREFQALADMASVCRAFPTSRRREHLSFTHHREVAALPPEKADDLLNRAEQDDWSTRDIRAEAAVHRKLSGGGNLISGQVRVEAYEWSALVGAWNRARYSVRERFLAAQNGTDAIE